MRSWGKILGLSVVTFALAGCVTPPSKLPPPTVTRPPTPIVRPPVTRALEMRGIWLRDPRSQDWERVMSDLQTAGFNSLFVNFATAGAAFYPSKVVPQISERDEMRLCLAAARRHGIAVHAKIICYFAYLSPSEFQKKLLRAGRELRESTGQPHRQNGDLWLDPAQEINRQHVVALAREILERYDVDGLQLDYIRADPNGRAATAAQSLAVEETVERVRGELRRLCPGKPLSAAVFHDIDRARETMGQDWPMWERRGLVDFFCPMDYTTNNADFSERVRAQQRAVGGAVLRVGIGGYKFTDADELSAQIALARRLNPAGFVIFAYTDDFRDKLMPRLRLANGGGR